MAQDQTDFVSFGLGLTEEQFSRLPKSERSFLIHQAERFSKEKDKNPLGFFIPNGAIEKFISGDKKKGIGGVGYFPVTGKRTYINVSANGVGKSAGAINMLGNFFWGPQTRWFNHPAFSQPWQFPKKVWYISESNSFQTKISPEMRKWFPRGRYEFIKSGRNFESHLTTDTGWIMQCMTYDQDLKQFESDDVGIMIYDEPPPKEIRDRCVGRLRMGGIEIFVMTPLEHSAWIFDDLIDKPEQQKELEVYYADIEDNCVEHGTRGILTHANIQWMISQWDEDQREARAHGKAKHLSGKIYKTLHPDRHRHETPPWQFNQDANVIYCVVDIHDRRPPAIVWYAAGTNGKMYAVDEYPNDPLQPYHTIKSTMLNYRDFARIIQLRERENGWTHPERIIRVMDPNYGNRQVQAVGKTIQQIFDEAGAEMKDKDGNADPWPMYFFADVNDELLTGHAEVKNLLGMDLDGTPKLTFGRNCFNLWFQMNRYGIKEHSPKRSEHDGLSERVGQKYKDFPDTCRYFAMMARTPAKNQAETAKTPQTRETDVAPRDQKPSGWQIPFSPGRRTSVTRVIK